MVNYEILCLDRHPAFSQIQSNYRHAGQSLTGVDFNFDDYAIETNNSTGEHTGELDNSLGALPFLVNKITLLLPFENASSKPGTIELVQVAYGLANKTQASEGEFLHSFQEKSNIVGLDNFLKSSKEMLTSSAWDPAQKAISI
jgi:hypothetical protein